MANCQKAECNRYEPGLNPDDRIVVFVAMHCLSQLADISPKGQLTRGLAELIQCPLPTLEGQSHSPKPQWGKPEAIPVRRLDSRTRQTPQHSHHPVYGSAIAFHLAQITGYSPEAISLHVKAQIENHCTDIQPPVLRTVLPTLHGIGTDRDGLDVTLSDEKNQLSPEQHTRSPSNIWPMVDVAVNSTGGLTFSFSQKGMALWFTSLWRQCAATPAPECNEQSTGDRPPSVSTGNTGNPDLADALWISQYAHARCTTALRLLSETGLDTHLAALNIDLNLLTAALNPQGSDRPSLYIQAVYEVLSHLMRAADAAFDGLHELDAASAASSESGVEPPYAFSTGKFAQEFVDQTCIRQNHTPTASRQLLKAMLPISQAILKFQAQFPPLFQNPSQSPSQQQASLHIWIALTQVTQRILHLLLVDVAGAIAPETL